MWEVSGVKCAVSGVQCEVWSLESEVKCEVWSVKSGECEVRSVKWRV